MTWVPPWLRPMWRRTIRPIPPAPERGEALAAVRQSDTRLQQSYDMQQRAGEVGRRAAEQTRKNHFGALLQDVYRRRR